MFFRGRSPEGSVWRRFRSGTDGFTYAREGDHFAAHIVANAERVVDLFHALLEQLPPAVSVEIEDLRSGAKWAAKQLALPDVRDAVARIKVPLRTYGGVEITIFSPEDQLSLNPHLELFVYSTTDQWLYILQGKGLQEQRSLRTRSWKLRRDQFPAAPELSDALGGAVERLALSLA